MVSAVFHSPSEASDAIRADKASAATAAHPSATSMTQAPATTQAPRPPIDWGGLLLKTLAPLWPASPC